MALTTNEVLHMEADRIKSEIEDVEANIERLKDEVVTAMERDRFGLGTFLSHKGLQMAEYEARLGTLKARLDMFGYLFEQESK